jgi:hypothetical protein
MKQKLTFNALLVLALFLALAPTILSSTTWYVGVNGEDSNNCMSPATPCKSIKHALTLISAGDTIRIAPAIYPETGNRIGTNDMSSYGRAGGRINPKKTKVVEHNTLKVVAVAFTQHK